MSLEMIRNNARSIAELIDSYNQLVKEQLFLFEKGESQERINELNAKILQVKLYLLKLITSIDSLVKQEEKL